MEFFEKNMLARENLLSFMQRSFSNTHWCCPKPQKSIRFLVNISTRGLLRVTYNSSGQKEQGEAF